MAKKLTRSVIPECFNRGSKTWIPAFAGMTKVGFALAILIFNTSIVYAKNDAAMAEVEVLRQEREAKMPYLDQGIIRSEINVQKVYDRKEFLGGSSAKSLDQIIERAVISYTPARAARERISLARRRILAALRALFPESALELNDRDGDLSDSNFTSFSYRFKFRQPLFRGGILWNTLLQEKAGLEAAEKEYAAALEDVVAEVATAYFEYNRSTSVLNSQENVASEIQKYVKISKRKHEEELISEIEHLNTQSLSSQIRYDYETSKQELELAKLDLQKLLGLGLEDTISIAPIYNIEALLKNRQKDETAAQAASPAPSAGGSSDSEAEKVFDFGEIPKELNLNQLVDTAYLNRPELQVEAAKLESARLEERIRWGNFLPHADAVLEFGRLGEAFADVDETPSRLREFRFSLEFNWNLSGNKLAYVFDNDQRAPTVSQFQANAGTNIRRNGLTIGLLDGLDDYVDSKEAEVARLEQVTQLEKKEKEVIQEVKKSFFDFQKARIQVRSSLQRVDYRQRLVKLSKHKLGKNEIQISEYLQAQIDLLQELTTLHKALADYNTTKAKLNHAIGVRHYLPLGIQHESTAKSS